jgi:hypothetical protein
MASGMDGVVRRVSEFGLTGPWVEGVGKRASGASLYVGAGAGGC